MKLTGERYEFSYGSEGYPDAFMMITSPPKKLYVIGNPEALSEGLAVVGARRATPYGKKAARMFASIAAQHGITIISGGARGCDAAAHRAALEVNGQTVVFLGGGCDCLYPIENAGLFQEIIDAGGAVVSENAWDFPPKPYTFRARNRLIAGLARAVLIVEAGMPSGTFSTADEALAANKDVLVVPGSILSPSSRGANRLLLEGAWPIVDRETFDEALSTLFGLVQDFEIQPTLFFDADKEMKTQGQKIEKAQQGSAQMSLKETVFDALCANPMRLEEIAHMVSSEIDDNKLDFQERLKTAMALVSELEYQGRITRYADGRFGVSS